MLFLWEIYNDKKFTNKSNTEEFASKFKFTFDKYFRYSLNLQEKEIIIYWNKNFITNYSFDKGYILSFYLYLNNKKIEEYIKSDLVNLNSMRFKENKINKFSGYFIFLPDVIVEKVIFSSFVKLNL